MTENRITDRRTVVVLCCLVAIAGVGISNCGGVFKTPICTDLDFLQSEYALTGTLSNFVTAFFTLRAPKFLEKHGVRKTILLATLLNGGSYIAKGFFNTIRQFALIGIVGGIGYSLFCITIIFIIINSYYREKSGVASSIVMCCSGLSGALFSPLFALLIEKSGWRMAMIISGLLVITLCAPIIIAGDRLVLTNTSAEKREENKNNILDSDKKKYLVLLCICFALAHFPVIFGQYLSSFGQSIGMSLTEASLLLSFAMVGNVISKLIDGYLCDHIGVMKANIFMYVINAFACIGYLFFKNGTLLIGTSLFFGFIYAITGMGMALVAKRVFSSQMYGRVYPVISLCGTAGYALWSVLVGFLYDLTGTYDIAIILCIVCGLLTIVINFYIYRKIEK